MSQIWYNAPMFCREAIFVKYCSTIVSCMSWLTLLRLLTARGKIVVKWDYYEEMGYCMSDIISLWNTTTYTPDGWQNHDDVIKWKHFPRNWPFVRGIHRSPVNSSHKGQWRGALMFSLICVWINDWVNNREAGDLRRYRAHSDVIVMLIQGQMSTKMNRRRNNSLLLSTYL